MCGLVATITKDVYCTNLDDWFKDALIASQLRGVHSTGIFQIGQNKSISTFKKAVNASTFVDLPDARPLILAATRAPITVGHVRHATQGRIVDSNAHPFVFVRDSDKSKVVGVHNGTLQGWKGKKGGDEQDVDSAWAFQKFAEEGPIDAFEYFNGAFAFIWYDTRTPDHLWTCRNDQRPLFYFQTDDTKTLMFASELGMLGWTAERNKFKNTGHQMYYTEADKIYKFSLKDVGAFETFDKPKYDPATTKVVASTHTNLVPYRNVGGEYEEYELPFGQGSSRYSTAGSSSTTRTTSHYEWDDQEYVLGKVKTALANARNAIDAGRKASESNLHEKVITTEDLDNSLEAGIKKSIEAFKDTRQFDFWALAGDHFIVGAVNDRNATSEEIRRARAIGMYGVAVAYSGVMYDDETGENLGDAFIRTKEPNAQCRQQDCLLRGLSKAAADVKYNDINAVVPCAIIGVTDGINKGDVMFVIAELTDDQVKDLQFRIEGVKQVLGVH
jgi:hypothetical protein